MLPILGASPRRDAPTTLKIPPHPVIDPDDALEHPYLRWRAEQQRQGVVLSPTFESRCEEPPFPSAEEAEASKPAAPVHYDIDPETCQRVCHSPALANLVQTPDESYYTPDDDDDEVDTRAPGEPHPDPMLARLEAIMNSPHPQLDVPILTLRRTTTTSPAEPCAAGGKRKRNNWTDYETDCLMHGVLQFGIGNWTKILRCGDFVFSRRTALDLKDRFRVKYPIEYAAAMEDAAHGPMLSTVLPDPRGWRPVVKGDQPAALVEFLCGLGLPSGPPPIPLPAFTSKPRRRPRTNYTAEEDAAIQAGFAKHGASWARIRDDPELQLTRRTATDIRDRVRTKFPDLYATDGRVKSIKPTDASRRPKPGDPLPLPAAKKQKTTKVAQTKKKENGKGKTKSAGKEKTKTKGKGKRKEPGRGPSVAEPVIDPALMAPARMAMPKIVSIDSIANQHRSPLQHAGPSSSMYGAADDCAHRPPTLPPVAALAPTQVLPGLHSAVVNPRETLLHSSGYHQQSFLSQRTLPPLTDTAPAPSYPPPHAHSTSPYAVGTSPRALPSLASCVPGPSDYFRRQPYTRQGTAEELPGLGAWNIVPRDEGRYAAGYVPPHPQQGYVPQQYGYGSAHGQGAYHGQTQGSGQREYGLPGLNDLLG